MIHSRNAAGSLKQIKELREAKLSCAAHAAQLSHDLGIGARGFLLTRVLPSFKAF